MLWEVLWMKDGSLSRFNGLVMWQQHMLLPCLGNGGEPAKDWSNHKIMFRHIQLVWVLRESETECRSEQMLYWSYTIPIGNCDAILICNYSAILIQKLHNSHMQFSYGIYKIIISKCGAVVICNCGAILIYNNGAIVIRKLHNSNL